MPMLELLKTHTHQGAVYRPGARIEVAEATARWLLARGIARLGPPPPGPPQPPPEPERPPETPRVHRGRPPKAQTPDPEPPPIADVTENTP
jgi:hypothetical protein